MSKKHYSSCCVLCFDEKNRKCFHHSYSSYGQWCNLLSTPAIGGIGIKWESFHSSFTCALDCAGSQSFLLHTVTSKKVSLASPRAYLKPNYFKKQHFTVFVIIFIYWQWCHGYFGWIFPCLQFQGNRDVHVVLVSLLADQLSSQFLNFLGWSPKNGQSQR